MDSIYSRKRIKLPKIKILNFKNKNAKKIFSIFIIIFIAIITFYSIYNSITPIFETLCIERARTIGTEIMNSASNQILDNTNYYGIVQIEKNGENNVLKTDVVKINKIASDIALEAENRFKNLENETISIPMGALTGDKYLSGFGPNMNIKVIPTGNILTEIKNEFESQGINQTVYRIYLELTCKVNIVTQYKTIEESLVNQVLLVETVVVGDVPESYYNLEGMDVDNAVDIIE